MVCFPFAWQGFLSLPFDKNKDRLSVCGKQAVSIADVK
jgi:hypothetical protein